MAKIRVAVLRGGPSAEYEISLMTGENVLKFLPKDKYQAHDVLISKDGVWHMDGFPTDPAKIFRRVDAVFNALHGEYGEDGIVQQILEGHKIPYTGSGILASAMAMKKNIAKDVYKNAWLKTPRGITLKKTANIKESVRDINETLFPPWIIKPVGRGSSVGVAIAKTVPDIGPALEKAFSYDNEALAEEFISGRETTCGVLENFRGSKYYALPVIEIIPPDGFFFDYKVKYNGETKEICPAHLDSKISEEIQNMSIAAHSALGLCHYSRSDFIVSKRGIYILETNTLPGLTSESLLPKASEAVGLSFPNLLDHLVSLALEK
ncbi:hypothetical protein A3I27_03255 [Candidatus Giovannonibacteria bacterium RIFCSPLOWO2_02_FULL_43_11b]|uniref:D-alanine--D-alanine ligase n=1 Tax=Candidatus Giovannonibacteria bacterium RIFCSPHIGHO2_12_FULL_43_15 TaxID=1798341 RepID=A0A1F5WNS1_9BACT|nr:MAG: hypothetical protein A3B97_01455 [Candidatus Giovannonibacteria bacterium RIFCSPHIGHO2_02_FULL_43_32]OGF77295.1 MAG: hypothetical protein A3F23_00375 [Candidatus Giovannonibacteria bacterium RIFCSPHIGHO2_12_FULL_43_15]OGF78016.1 MAG: hypothetical protein A3A15_01160 [Candidatus Giovannonibacteria bacterium RIFCSPLOWO2_01_FULL_43_60]OGF89739.1 MAG: hypothetical protein A3I27_03255 [Candidatus Giovannonibacteria bacterium RIFCSPLOWO2_02_FULL_43_11b]OGF91741.1 MAG: hypothetical protein A3H